MNKTMNFKLLFIACVMCNFGTKLTAAEAPVQAPLDNKVLAAAHTNFKVIEQKYQQAAASIYSSSDTAEVKAQKLSEINEKHICSRKEYLKFIGLDLESIVIRMHFSNGQWRH